MSSPDSPGWDPGLQNERTTLAWVRTALSFVAAGTLTGKQTGAGVTFAALVMASLAAAAVLVVTAERRYAHRYDQLAAAPHIVSLPAVTVTAAGTIILGLVSLSIVLICSTFAPRVPLDLVCSYN